MGNEKLSRIATLDKLLRLYSTQATAKIIMVLSRRSSFCILAEKNDSGAEYLNEPDTVSHGPPRQTTWEKEESGNVDITQYFSRQPSTSEQKQKKEKKSGCCCSGCWGVPSDVADPAEEEKKQEKKRKEYKELGLAADI